MGDSVTAPVDIVLDTVDADIHSAIVRALATGKRLELSYATATRDEVSDRQVDPRRLFTEQGKLYLEAWCLKAEDLRFFRLDRILTAEVTAIDVEDHDATTRDLSDGFFTVGEQTPYVLVDLHPRAHWLTEYYQVDLLEQNDDGVWRAKIYGADLDWLRRLVLRNAGSVTVIEPSQSAHR
ncbi:helix-turn-helix transcriptional regulator [Aeromicrobium sp. UC242_57]|uniref:helix-turn-helix transcriptional regulator n=1 Tax=Aeromicrobium sp. UC242_57 TaxID=3374624 RepID=UPI0037A5877A